MIADLQQSIAAIASPPGHAARGIVRLSGPRIVESLDKCFRPARGAPELLSIQRPSVINGFFRVEPPIDQVPVDLYYWPGAASYTRQRSAEIHCVGAPPILDEIMRMLGRHGIRQAQPGEFTLRAFLAGRIDLPQAEAVVGVIDAHSEHEMKIALRQLSGGLTGPIESIRENLLDVLSEIEAGLDFVEDDIEFISRDSILGSLANAKDALEKLLDQIDRREAHERVFRVVLYGRPNVGKSCLLNALTDDPKALVSEIEGTTRDYVVGEIERDGVRVQLIDTAGLDQVDTLKARATDQIQVRAQAQSSNLIEESHLNVFCVDGSNPITNWDIEQMGSSKAQLVVQTKADLPAAWELSAAHRVSSLLGTGLDELRSKIFDRFSDGADISSQLMPTTANRCYESLTRARRDLSEAVAAASGEHGEEIIAAQIRSVLNELAVVTGRVYTDDILDRIFGRFCIGK